MFPCLRVSSRSTCLISDYTCRQNRWISRTEVQSLRRVESPSFNRREFTSRKRHSQNGATHFQKRWVVFYVFIFTTRVISCEAVTQLGGHCVRFASRSKILLHENGSNSYFVLTQPSRVCPCIDFQQIGTVDME